MPFTRLLPLLLVASLVAAACGDDDTTATNATTSTTAAPTSTTADADTGGSDYVLPSDDSVADGVTVTVANDAELGDHLVDGDGRTLYLFERDQGTTTACTGTCADNWPPLVADGQPTASDGVDAGALATSPDGIEPGQVTYHGHLLYYFAGDQEPGDANGTSIPGWYVVAPSGEAIDAD